MIDPDERLWAGSGGLLNGGPYTWYITDFDTRRTFSVTYAPGTPVDDLEGTEEICLAQLQRHVDELGEGDYGIRFSEPGGPITVSRDPRDDETIYVNCHPLSHLKHPFPLKTIYVDAMTELDGLTPQVDLVSYDGDPTIDVALLRIKAVFKYWFMLNGMFRTWYELNSRSRLPRDHPHIVPFDSVVLDRPRGGIVGFTTRFIPGGTLKENDARTRPFRLEWLHQLMSVLDDLNYRYGIMHQDVAARNLVVDEHDNLRIFDFNYSIMIGEHYTPDRDDTKGVIFTLYEIMTLDEHYRDVPYDQQDGDALLKLEWTPHPDVKLDSDVKTFRDALDAWVSKRKARTFEPRDTWVKWPWMPKEPEIPVFSLGSDEENPATEILSVPVLVRRHLDKMGEPYYNWERPPSYRLWDVLCKKGSQKDANVPPDLNGTNGEETGTDKS